MISIRKLAAVDMAWLGKKVILAEYAIGILLPLVIGLLSLRSAFVGPFRPFWQTAFGAWLVSIAANYIPLFVYALQIARHGSVEEEGKTELKQARRYGLQQIIILVPFLVVAVALIQERQIKTKQ